MSYPDKMWVMIRKDIHSGKEYYDIRTLSIVPLGTINKATMDEENSPNEWPNTNPRVGIAQIELKEIAGTRTVPYSVKPTKVEPV